MGISVDYGPISTAMGLAQQAGAAQRQQIGFGEDMQGLQFMLGAQRQAASQRANEISQSLQGQQLGLEAQRNQAQQQLAQAQLQSSHDYQMANLNSLNTYRQGQVGNAAQRNQNTADYNQGRVDIGQQNADTRSQMADQTDAYHQMLAGIGQQNADTRQQGMQTGQQRQGTYQQATDDKQIQDAYNGLANQAKAMEGNAAKNFGDVSKDPQYQQIKQQMQAIQAQIAGNVQQSQAARPAVAPQAIKQIAAQGGVNPQLQNQVPQQPDGTYMLRADNDYNAIPSGAKYIDPQDGKSYVKK